MQIYTSYDKAIFIWSNFYFKRFIKFLLQTFMNMVIIPFFGWARSPPMGADITYVTTSFTGEDLAKS